WQIAHLSRNIFSASCAKTGDAIATNASGRVNRNKELFMCLLLKIFGPADSEQITAEVISGYDFLDVVGALQLQRETANLRKSICDRTCDERPLDWTGDGQFPADFTHSGRAQEVAADADVQLRSRFRIHPRLPNAIDRLVPPGGVQRGRSPKEGDGCRSH